MGLCRIHGASAVSIVTFWIALLAVQCDVHSTPLDGIAPDFELTGVDGSPHRLSDYKGNVVIISFWASWCTECVAELPALEDIHRSFADRGIVILSISIDRDEEAMRKVLRKFPASYPVLRDTSGEVFIKLYTVTSLPTLLLVDRKGILRDRIEGGTDLASPDFVRKLDAIIREGGRNR